MKNIKNYAMALVALVIAATSLTLMSFVKKEQSSNWYPVNTSGIISSTPLSSPPSNSPDDPCSTAKNTDMCAIEIELNPANPFPTSVTQAQTDHNVTDEAYSRLVE
ncbi:MULTISPECIES: hypothetical protein [Sphingobacterium]|jgi:hypothetical protein|uniref:hypothetical protein n=2 Tax=Sphingobacteriaceae TaxID=84566 RepID=UPI00123019E6|nr:MULTISPECIES: hypothetical protein [Sphingobacterium]